MASVAVTVASPVSDFKPPNPVKGSHIRSKSVDKNASR